MKTLNYWNRLLMMTMLAIVPRSVSAAGGQDIQNIFIDLIAKFWPLWGAVGVLVLVIAGFTLMTSQDENSLQKAKTTLISVITGGILATIILSDPLGFISIVYNGVPGTGIVNTGNIIGLEAMGIAEWFSAMAVMLGILFIIVAVLRAVASFGDEAAYTAARSSLFHVIAGVILIAGAYVIQRAFFGSGGLINPNELIGFVTYYLYIILNLITLIAVAILIYAGLRMIVSFGKEEDFTAARSLVIRVLLGIVILLISYSLVWTVATLFT